jgi:hypothetical protein
MWRRRRDARTGGVRSTSLPRPRAASGHSPHSGQARQGRAARAGAALGALVSLALLGLPTTALARAQLPAPATPNLASTNLSSTNLATPNPSSTGARATGARGSGAQGAPRQAQAPAHLPAGLQAAIDKTLSGEPASTPAGLSLTWGRAGAVSFHPSKAAKQGFSLRPVSFGGARLEAFSPGPFVFGQKDVTEALGHGASAWYKASAKGFEQGFTISRPPSGTSKAFSIVLAYAGSLHPSSAAAHGFVISGRSGPEMTYGGLRATDANAKALPARLVLGEGTVRISVDATDAAYPVSIESALGGPNVRSG